MWVLITICAIIAVPILALITLNLWSHFHIKGLRKHPWKRCVWVLAEYRDRLIKRVRNYSSDVPDYKSGPFSVHFVRDGERLRARVVQEDGGANVMLMNLSVVDDIPPYKIELAPEAQAMSDEAKGRLSALVEQAVYIALNIGSDRISSKSLESLLEAHAPAPAGSRRQGPTAGETSQQLKVLQDFIDARLGQIVDGDLADALAAMRLSVGQVKDLLIRSPHLVKSAWPLLDYAVPKSKEVLEDYLRLNATSARLSGDERAALAGARQTLLRLPAVFDDHLRALRSEDFVRLADASEALEAIAINLDRPVKASEIASDQ